MKLTINMCAGFLSTKNNKCYHQASKASKVQNVKNSPLFNLDGRSDRWMSINSKGLLETTLKHVQCMWKHLQNAAHLKA